MIEDTDTNPGADDTEIVESNEEVTEPEGEDLETEGSDQEVQEPEDEEIELDGKQYRIPKPLKGAFLMHKDYTQKTQSHAEAVKNFEAQTKAQREAIENERKSWEQDRKEYAAMEALGQSIAQYEQQIAQLRQAGNHEAAQRMWMEMADMERAARKIAAGVAQKQHERTQEQERTRANQLRERDERAASMIPGFTPALLSKIQEYAVADGYKPDEAQSIRDPRFLKTLNDARLWNEHQAKAKAAAAKAKQQAEPQVQPTPTVASRKPPERLSADLAKRDPERWVELRNRQLAAKGRH